MERWLIHETIALTQSLLLAGAAWSWAAFCSVTVARCGPVAFLDATARSLRLAALSSVFFVAAASIDLHFVPRAELLGVRRLTIAPPFTWWVWAGLLICEPVVTCLKVARLRPLLNEAASLQGAPLEVKPRWVKLCEDLLIELVSASNYV